MADTFKPCSVDGCNKNAHHSAKGARGWCNKHHRRWSRHGDPCGGGTEYGLPAKFVETAVSSSERRDCLIWPFSRGSHGYGQISRNGKPVLVHRLVCEAAHGPAPSSEMDVAHSCGRGGAGCVNPFHLRWATTAENMADRLAHGTTNRGERHGAAKLTRADVAKIRSLRASGAPGQSIADELGANLGTVWGVIYRKSWDWLP